MQPLNNSLEAGVRALVLLSAVFPEPLDIGRLVYFDHSLLHSADVGGPPSLHPDLPSQPGEVGIKRGLIEQGLQIMIRVNLIEINFTESGIEYNATEQAPGFLEILEAPYVARLVERAEWIKSNIHPLDDAELTAAMSEIFDRWSEEFSVGSSVEPRNFND